MFKIKELSFHPQKLREEQQIQPKEKEGNDYLGRGSLSGVHSNGES